MNRDDRASIFSRPFEDDDLDADVPSAAGEPTVARPAGGGQPPVRPRPPRDFEPALRVPAREPINRQVIVLAGMSLAIVALAGFIGASFLRADDVPAVAVATATPTVVPSPTSQPTGPAVTPAPTAGPTPTPVPTPAGPPVEVAVGGWATVTVDELEVRASAGSSQASLYRLVRGAVVHVAEGPATADAGNWYRVVSLGGAKGWVSSGWGEEALLDTIAGDPTLNQCGQVRRSVFDVTGGSPTPNDALRIGDRAVPSAAFSTTAVAAIELLRGMGQEACFSARVGADGTPVVSADLSVGACGHAEVDGGLYRLVPADDGRVSLASQVMDPTIVHPSLLDGGPADHRMSPNMRTIVGMMANDGTSGCLHVNVTQRGSATESYRSVSVQQCSIVQRYNEHSLELAPASGGPLAWIRLPSTGYFERGLFPLDTPVMVSVDASVGTDGGPWAGAWRQDNAGCR